MIRTIQHRFALALIAAACALPTPSFAQPAAASPSTSSDSLSAQDREILATAEQLASDATQALERWISSQSISQDRLFARIYLPVPKTDPYKFTTPYDALAQRDFVAPQDRALAKSPSQVYAIITDINGYVAVHNSRYNQPLTGDAATDYANNQSRRLLGDIASFAAGKNRARYLQQRVQREAGEVIYEISVPVMVRGQHWGCVRVGYNRTEP